MMDIPTEPITFNLYYGGKSAVEVLESGEKVPAKVDPLPVDETTPCFPEYSCEESDMCRSPSRIILQRYS